MTLLKRYRRTDRQTDGQGTNYMYHYRALQCLHLEVHFRLLCGRPVKPRYESCPSARLSRTGF